MTRRCVAVFIALIAVFFADFSSAAPLSPALQDLYKAAKAEGQVIWQYSASLNDVKGLTSVFQTKYPEIKLSVFSFSAARTPTRIIGEAAGKRLTLDVATFRQYHLIPLIERDLLVKYDWTKLGVAQSDIIFDGVGTLILEFPYVWVRNTNLVSEAEAPKTWEDLLDPKWKGHKISMRAASSAFTPLYLIWRKDKQKAVDYISRMKKQEVVPGDRMAIVMSRVATGECLIGRVAMPYVIEALKEKAPIAILPIGPTADFGNLVCIPKGVPHPNAAKFFISWLSSPEAEQEWAKVGLGRAYPPEASFMAQLLAKNGIKYERISSKEDIVDFEENFAKMVVKIMDFTPGAE